MSQLPQPPPLEMKNNNKNKNKKKSKKMPSPQELVSHYEKQGMETQDASLKVIQELQGALFRIIAANRSSPKSADVTSAKLDAIHSRLLQIEMKVDSKPSYPQALAIGVAASGLWNAAGLIWNSVRRATSSSPDSS